MRYLISQYGNGIAVGLTQEEGSQEDINLAHNLFNIGCNEDIFHGVINFPSFRKFFKFLVYKEYFKIANNTLTKKKFGDRRKKENKEWFRAIKQARLVVESSVSFQNFMGQMRYQTTPFRMGFYQDELGEE